MNSLNSYGRVVFEGNKRIKYFKSSCVYLWREIYFNLQKEKNTYFILLCSANVTLTFLFPFFNWIPDTQTSSREVIFCLFDPGFLIMCVQTLKSIGDICWRSQVVCQCHLHSSCQCRDINNPGSKVWMGLTSGTKTPESAHFKYLPNLMFAYHSKYMCMFEGIIMRTNNENVVNFPLK